MRHGVHDVGRQALQIGEPRARNLSRGRALRIWPYDVMLLRRIHRDLAAHRPVSCSSTAAKASTIAQTTGSVDVNSHTRFRPRPSILQIARWSYLPCTPALT